MEGWIKLHRSLMTKPIWTDSTPEQKTILITLLMMANHQGREWEWKGEKYKADPGQFVTSLESIVKKAGNGISTRNVRTALQRFEKYEFLTNESTNKNRLITVVNWAFYQAKDNEGDKQTDRQLTSNRQATDKQLTTNKNVKKEKNDKNVIKETYTPEFEQFWNVYPRKLSKKRAYQCWIKRIKKEDINKLIQSAQNYADYCKEKGTEEQYIKHPATFLSDKLDYQDWLEKKEVKPNVIPIKSNVKRDKLPSSMTNPPKIVMSDEELAAKQKRAEELLRALGEEP